ncbi:hypothetical protein I4U23_009419 [Adineta vaga]|nr:hypothetical protein I4U23_009419 [Adineta vaga]
MYLFTILSALICIQLVTQASSVFSEVTDNERLHLSPQLQSIYNNDETSNSNSESVETNDYDRRSTAFLRFGRQLSSSAGFLRFGRSNPTFLRFGRSNPTFLRFGRSNPTFRRSGRRMSDGGSFLRFGRKGEFLRFG